MGLKILHSADWHLDSPFAGFTEQQRQFLKAEQQKIPGKITQLCIREDCDMMLLAGDIFDDEPTRETLDILKRELESCGVPVLIAPGNHDFCNEGSHWREERWPENVFVFTGGLESVTIQGLNCRIYGAGFQSMDSSALLEGFQAEGDEKYCIAVLHGDPMQRNSPYNPVTSAQVRNSCLDYLALGHVHKAGAFRSGETLCAWPGCPMGRGYDETGEKGVLLVELAETVETEFISLGLPCFYDLQTDAGSNPAAAVARLLPPAGSDDYYRITLTGYADNVDTVQLCAKFNNYPHLQLRDKTVPEADLWGAAGEDSLEGLYFGMLRCAANGQNEESRRRAILAAQISRQILDGQEVKLP